MDGVLAIAFVALLVAALLLLRQAERQRRRTGLPQGRVIYADTGARSRVERPLFSRRYRLTGKPDYLLDDGGEIIPVEVKSGKAPPQPYPSHVLQLAAYCLLVEETYNACPSYGVIRYRDQAFAVDFTPELEDWLLLTLNEMREGFSASNVPRNHGNAAQCAACGYRPYCDQSLA
jgi:CRISPR-associated exonuclease Cas4